MGLTRASNVSGTLIRCFTIKANDLVAKAGSLRTNALAANTIPTSDLAFVVNVAADFCTVSCLDDAVTRCWYKMDGPGWYKTPVQELVFFTFGKFPNRRLEPPSPLFRKGGLDELTLDAGTSWHG